MRYVEAVVAMAPKDLAWPTAQGLLNLHQPFGTLDVALMHSFREHHWSIRDLVDNAEAIQPSPYLLLSSKQQEWVMEAVGQGSYKARLFRLAQEGR